MTYPSEPPRSRTHPALIAALAALVLIVGGLATWLIIGRGGDTNGQVPAAAAGSTTPAPKATAPAPVGAKTKDLKLGAKVTVPASDDVPSATIQVIAYKRDASLGEEAAMDAVQIRMCLGTEKSGTTSVSAGPWSLIYGGGESRHQEVSTGGPDPAYPTLDERQVGPGECIKGWLAFTDIKGEPEGVAYDLSSGFAASWRFS